MKKQDDVLIKKQFIDEVPPYKKEIVSFGSRSKQQPDFFPSVILKMRKREKRKKIDTIESWNNAPSQFLKKRKYYGEKRKFYMPIL